MKYRITTALFLLITLLVSATVMSRPKERKLPVGAYMKAAKIEILSGDQARYKTAIALLDSLFMYYGPHAEALELMANIMVDGMEKAPSPKTKMPYVENMVAYFDSLRMCCDSKEVKSKYKKNCKKLTVKADSTKVKYWREYYNLGIEQLNYVQELAVELEEETDSTARDFTIETRDANIDSCITNFQLAIIIDPGDFQPYVATGNAYEYAKDFPKAINWLSLGLDKVSSREKLLLPIAYDHIRQDQYCEAIPFFREFTEIFPDSVQILSYLSSCYNNCEMYDSAAVVYKRMLSLEPENTDVLTGMGRFFNQQARDASNQAKDFSEAEDDAKAKEWRAKQYEAIDSSIVYFRKVFELKPDDVFAAEEYGMVSAIRENYEDAVAAFTALTRLDPERKENWMSLGDCYVNLHQFNDAIPAYEKVVELDPGNLSTWERLKDLYYETRQTAKKAAAEKRIAELK